MLFNLHFFIILILIQDWFEFYLHYFRIFLEQLGRIAILSVQQQTTKSCMTDICLYNRVIYNTGCCMTSCRMGFVRSNGITGSTSLCGKNINQDRQQEIIDNIIVSALSESDIM